MSLNPEAPERVRQVHDAYANPVDGGWAGYQAACWDCDWRGPHREQKKDARADAREHEAATR